MARVLLLISAAVVFFFGAMGCAAPETPARPTVTVTASAQPASTVPGSARATTTVVATSTSVAPTTTKAPVTTKSKDERTLAEQRKAACRKDENQCYEPGTNTKCSTGGCVDAARGMTQRDVETERDRWLREHPGWCAAGETGAVAPC
ncbi:hypothetical protein [Amycolatopsis pittospori]|uniref:hypothetical protein n=1 Tax=Amycolatopsis pittospori TaxID=2749434 RepID=UPI0015F0442E|nr:hypothetical protein [Amycolatopsis pittospori]